MWSSAARFVLGLSFGLEAAHGAHQQAVVHRTHRMGRDTEVVSFDRTVLGNLGSAKELKDLSFRRSHLFVVEIEVGTPAQRLRCLVDSGTADIWLPSTRCVDCGSKQNFRAQDSSTFVPETRRSREGLRPVPVQASYGSGNIVGFLVQETISIGNHHFANQTFVIVEEEELPRHRSWDGVCGFGWRRLEDAGTPMYMNARMGQRVFALVPRDSESTFLTVGALPEQRLQASKLAWSSVVPLMPSDSRSYWVVPGGVSVNAEQTLTSRLLIDTATAYVLAPRRHFQSLMRALLPEKVFERSCGVDAAAGNLVVCDCADTLDSDALDSLELKIHMGGLTFAIAARRLFKRVPARDQALLCLLLIQQAPAAAVPENPLEVLGDLLAPGKAARAGEGAKDGPLLFPGLVPVSTKSVPGAEGRRLRKDEQEGDEDRGSLVGMEDLWVLGGLVLEHLAVVFDFEHSRLGLALPAVRKNGVRVLPGAEQNVEILPGISSKQRMPTPSVAHFSITGVLVGVGLVGVAIVLVILLYGKTQSRRNLTDDSGAE